MEHEEVLRALRDARQDESDVRVIVPIPEPHLHDPDADLWTEVRDLFGGWR